MTFEIYILTLSDPRGEFPLQEGAASASARLRRPRSKAGAAPAQQWNAQEKRREEKRREEKRREEKRSSVQWRNLVFVVNSVY